MTAILKKFFEDDNIIVFDENNIPGVGDISDIQQDVTDLETNKADKLFNNLEATVDPTVNNDSTEGYEPLSIWFNNNSGEIFKCMDATEGAAVWVKTTLTIDELGSMALESADDYYNKTDIDNEVVKLTGDQTIDGIKTFTDSPIVPTPTTDMQTATKKYVDDNGGGGGVIFYENNEEITGLTGINLPPDGGLYFL